MNLGENTFGDWVEHEEAKKSASVVIAIQPRSNAEKQ